MFRRIFKIVWRLEKFFQIAQKSIIVALLPLKLIQFKVFPKMLYFEPMRPNGSNMKESKTVKIEENIA